MSRESFDSRLAALLRTVKPKAKQPASAAILNQWINQAEGQLGPEAKGGRLGWLIASSVAIACVQRAIDSDGKPLFLLKGGTLLQHRLSATARPTKDVDGLIRGDLDEFLLALEDALDQPWGPLTLRRSEVEIVNAPTKIIKPRRFDIIIALRGVTWRRIQFEVSPDESGIGHDCELIEPPPLRGFGLPDPDTLAGIAMRFQIAQKIHAVSDPHEPPESINDRARDVVDLILLQDLAAETGSPTFAEIHSSGGGSVRRARRRSPPARIAASDLAPNRDWARPLGERLQAGSGLDEYRLLARCRSCGDQCVDRPDR